MVVSEGDLRPKTSNGQQAVDIVSHHAAAYSHHRLQATIIVNLCDNTTVTDITFWAEHTHTMERGSVMAPLRLIALYKSSCNEVAPFP